MVGLWHCGGARYAYPLRQPAVDLEMRDRDPRPRPLAALALSLSLVLVLAAGGLEAAEDEERDLFGWVERVELTNVGFELKAKLDTGAETSSLDAIHIKRFRRKGESWVRFTIEDPQSDEEVELERPLIRRVKIKRHEGEPQRRSVVELEVCLGDHRRKVEFSLIDRSEFIYPVLLGRQALAGIAVVDPKETFLFSPDCPDDD